MKQAHFWSTAARALLLAFCLGATHARGADKPITLKLGTLAPMGSSFHKSLLAMAEKWRNLSGGTVRLTIYAGGTQGGESDMVGLMQTGSLDAGLLTTSGLSDIEPAVVALQTMPMAFRTLDEVDYVGEKLAPSLAKRLAAKGYTVLFWSNSGWTRFFTTAPVLHPADLQKLKVFSWAGDAHEFDVWKAAGFNPVSLETGGIAQGFLSGSINAIATPPLFALAGQLDSQAKYMLDLNWGPLAGAMVVRQKSWERIPAATREALLGAAAEAGKRVTIDARAENDRAVQAMVKRGLTVQKVTPAVVQEWADVLEKVKGLIRGKIVPDEAFDEAQRLIQEYRSTHAATPK